MHGSDSKRRSLIGSVIVGLAVAAVWVGMEVLMVYRLSLRDPALFGRLGEFGVFDLVMGLIGSAISFASGAYYYRKTRKGM